MQLKFRRLMLLSFRAIIISCSIYFMYKAVHLVSNDPVILGKYFSYKFFIWAHVIGGMSALAIGPFLIWQPRREAYLTLHRLLGRLYVAGVALGSGGAIVLAVTTTLLVGWSYTFSLHALGFTWLSTTLLAWFAAVRREIKIHKRWMSYSYIATVAFVFQALLFENSILATLGPFAEIYPSVIWGSWVVPFVVYTQWVSVQDLLRKRRQKPAVHQSAVVRTPINSSPK